MQKCKDRSTTKDKIVTKIMVGDKLWSELREADSFQKRGCLLLPGILNPEERRTVFRQFLKCVMLAPVWADGLKKRFEDLCDIMSVEEAYVKTITEHENPKLRKRGSILPGAEGWATRSSAVFWSKFVEKLREILTGRTIGYDEVQKLIAMVKFQDATIQAYRADHGQIRSPGVKVPGEGEHTDSWKALEKELANGKKFAISAYCNIGPTPVFFTGSLHGTDGVSQILVPSGASILWQHDLPHCIMASNGDSEMSGKMFYNILLNKDDYNESCEDAPSLQAMMFWGMPPYPSQKDNATGPGLVPDRYKSLSSGPKDDKKLMFQLDGDYAHMIADWWNPYCCEVEQVKTGDYAGELRVLPSRKREIKLLEEMPDGKREELGIFAPRKYDEDKIYICQALRDRVFKLSHPEVTGGMKVEQTISGNMKPNNWFNADYFENNMSSMSSEENNEDSDLDGQASDMELD